MAKKRVVQQALQERTPFWEVKLVFFNFSTKSRGEAAFLQYNLLLKPEILQLHLDFETKKGCAVCAPSFDLTKELSDAKIEHKLILVEWLPYKEYQERNVSCSI